MNHLFRSALIAAGRNGKVHATAIATLFRLRLRIRQSAGGDDALRAQRQLGSGQRHLGQP